MNLQFKKATKQQDYEDIYNYNIDAFSDSPDFNWNLEEIVNEVNDGWELYAAYAGEDIIAALFFKCEGDALLTKNTAVKMIHKGSGYSQEIKDFFTEKAKELNKKRIYHYCRIDNFRMYSLNEKHSYKKTSKRLGTHGEVVEWVKVL